MWGLAWVLHRHPAEDTEYTEIFNIMYSHEIVSWYQSKQTEAMHSVIPQQNHTHHSTVHYFLQKKR